MNNVKVGVHKGINEAKVNSRLTCNGVTDLTCLGWLWTLSGVVEDGRHLNVR